MCDCYSSCLVPKAVRDCAYSCWSRQRWGHCFCTTLPARGLDALTNMLFIHIHKVSLKSTRQKPPGCSPPQGTPFLPSLGVPCKLQSLNCNLANYTSFKTASSLNPFLLENNTELIHSHSIHHTTVAFLSFEKDIGCFCLLYTVQDKTIFNSLTYIQTSPNMFPSSSLINRNFIQIGIYLCK